MTPEESPQKSQNRLVGKQFKTRIKQPTPIRDALSSQSGTSTHNRFGFRLTDLDGKVRESIKKEL